MSARSHPRSRTSSSKLPALRVDVRPSSALRLSLATLGAVLLIALAIAPGAFHLLRAGLAIAAAALAWGPFSQVVLRRGKSAIASIEWTGAGDWHLTDRGGHIHTATLCSSSVTLGSWLLLRWKTASGRRLWALIEPERAGPKAFRTLKGRLNC